VVHGQVSILWIINRVADEHRHVHRVDGRTSLSARISSVTGCWTGEKIRSTSRSSSKTFTSQPSGGNLAPEAGVDERGQHPLGGLGLDEEVDGSWSTGWPPRGVHREAAASANGTS
jgi:hypothetical protein